MTTFPVRHDFHVHSTLSSCCHDENMTPENILSYAEGHGYRALCLTNHLWDAAVPGAWPWYQPQDIAHSRQALPLPQSGKVRFLFGCEAEFAGGTGLSLAREHFEQFDFVVIPINHMHMKGNVRPAGVDTAEKMAALFTKRMRELLSLPLPFEKVGLAHLNVHLLFAEEGAAAVLCRLDRAVWRELFSEAAGKGAGIELNAAAFAKAQQDWDAHIAFFELAREAGCKFYFGSDAHRLDALDETLLDKAADDMHLHSGQWYVPPCLAE